MSGQSMPSDAAGFQPTINNGDFVERLKYSFIHFKHACKLRFFLPGSYLSFFLIAFALFIAYLLMFPLVNIFGGVGDMYFYFRIVSIEPEKRVEWVDRSDEKILKSIIWKKEIN